MKLNISYFEDVDFLTLWNERLTDGGEDASAYLTAFFDDSDDSVISFTIQGAARNLSRFCMARNPSAKIEYTERLDNWVIWRMCRC